LLNQTLDLDSCLYLRHDSICGQEYLAIYVDDLRIFTEDDNSGAKVQIEIFSKFKISYCSIDFGLKNLG